MTMKLISDKERKSLIEGIKKSENIDEDHKIVSEAHISLETNENDYVEFRVKAIYFQVEKSTTRFQIHNFFLEKKEAYEVELFSDAEVFENYLMVRYLTAIKLPKI